MKSPNTEKISNL